MTSPWKKQIDFKVPPSPCPNCGTVQDGSGEFLTRKGEPPVIGDIAVCLDCAAVNRYGIGLVLEAIPEDELAVLLIDTDLLDTVAAVRRFVARR